nr:glycosyltransferase [Capnocytophaga ochracea]
MENLREVLNFRKISERFGREVRGILVKKGCKEGGGSL